MKFTSASNHEKYQSFKWYRKYLYVLTPLSSKTILRKADLKLMLRKQDQGWEFFVELVL